MSAAEREEERRETCVGSNFQAKSALFSVLPIEALTVHFHVLAHKQVVCISPLAIFQTITYFTAFQKATCFNSF